MRVLYKGKVWDKEAVQKLIMSNDRMVTRTLILVYDNQTEDEKQAHSARHLNNKGFTAYDANYWGRMAKMVKRDDCFRSRAVFGLARRQMPKYWRQVLDAIAAQEGAQLLKRNVKL